MFKLAIFSLSENDSRVKDFGLMPFAIVYKKYNQALKFLSFSDIKYLQDKGVSLYGKVNQNDLEYLLKTL